MCPSVACELGVRTVDPSIAASELGKGSVTLADSKAVSNSLSCVHKLYWYICGYAFTG